MSPATRTNLIIGLLCVLATFALTEAWNWYRALPSVSHLSTNYPGDCIEILLRNESTKPVQIYGCSYMLKATPPGKGPARREQIDKEPCGEDEPAPVGAMIGEPIPQDEITLRPSSELTNRWFTRWQPFQIDASKASTIKLRFEPVRNLTGRYTVDLVLWYGERNQEKELAISDLKFDVSKK